jgi:hypothetical protein
MIEKTITGANQWTKPIYVPSGTYLSFSIIEHDDPWSARVSVQMIPDPDGINLPNDADANWRSIDQFDMTSNPVTKVGQGNMGWFRVGVATGDFISGEATVSIWLSR